MDISLEGIKTASGIVVSHGNNPRLDLLLFCMYGYITEDRMMTLVDNRIKYTEYQDSDAHPSSSSAYSYVYVCSGFPVILCASTAAIYWVIDMDLDITRYTPLVGVALVKLGYTDTERYECVCNSIVSIHDVMQSVQASDVKGINRALETSIHSMGGRLRITWKVNNMFVNWITCQDANGLVTWWKPWKLSENDNEAVNSSVGWVCETLNRTYCRMRGQQQQQLNVHNWQFDKRAYLDSMWTHPFETIDSMMDQTNHNHHPIEISVQQKNAMCQALCISGTHPERSSGSLEMIVREALVTNAIMGSHVLFTATNDHTIRTMIATVKQGLLHQVHTNSISNDIIEFIVTVPEMYQQCKQIAMLCRRIYDRIPHGVNVGPLDTGPFQLVSNILNYNICLITGPPGHGKTGVLRALYSAVKFKSNGRANVVMFATTVAGARNVGTGCLSIYSHRTCVLLDTPEPLVIGINDAHLLEFSDFCSILQIIAKSPAPRALYLFGDHGQFTKTTTHGGGGGSPIWVELVSVAVANKLPRLHLAQPNRWINEPTRNGIYDFIMLFRQRHAGYFPVTADDLISCLSNCIQELAPRSDMYVNRFPIMDEAMDHCVCTAIGLTKQWHANGGIHGLSQVPPNVLVVCETIKQADIINNMIQQFYHPIKERQYYTLILNCHDRVMWFGPNQQNNVQYLEYGRVVEIVGTHAYVEWYHRVIDIDSKIKTYPYLTRKSYQRYDCTESRAGHLRLAYAVSGEHDRAPVDHLICMYSGIQDTGYYYHTWSRANQSLNVVISPPPPPPFKLQNITQQSILSTPHVPLPCRYVVIQGLSHYFPTIDKDSNTLKSSPLETPVRMHRIKRRKKSV
jgi:hypothetical protein